MTLRRSTRATRANAPEESRLVGAVVVVVVKKECHRDRVLIYASPRTMTREGNVGGEAGSDEQ